MNNHFPVFGISNSRTSKLHLEISKPMVSSSLNELKRESKIRFQRFNWMENPVAQKVVLKNH